MFLFYELIWLCFGSFLNNWFVIDFLPGVLEEIDGYYYLSSGILYEGHSLTNNEFLFELLIDVKLVFLTIGWFISLPGRDYLCPWRVYDWLLIN